MADSLVLKGVKDVVKHKGSELLLMRPKRGGDTHQIKKWWLMNPASTVYVSASLFRVQATNGTMFLAVDSHEKSQIRIDHDGEGNFNFYGISGIDRAALFDVNMQLIEHYVFPKISGGKTMVVTPAGAADRPAPAGNAQPAAAEEAPAQPAAPEQPVETIEDRAAAADHTYAVTVQSYYNNNKYYLNGSRQAEITANAGETIYFDLSDASLSGHPLAIYTDDTKTTTVTVGVETSGDGYILLFTPPISGNFSYQCTQHNGMGGDITVS